jgi:hypothetical protein
MLEGSSTFRLQERTTVALQRVVAEDWGKERPRPMITAVCLEFA